MTVNSLGGALGRGTTRSREWLLPLVPIAISIFAVSALVSYHLRVEEVDASRTLLQGLIVGIYQFFGWVPSCMFFALCFAWSSIWFVTGAIERPGQKLLRIGMLTLALAVYTNLGGAQPHTGGLGAWLGGGVVGVLGSFLSHLLMAPVTFFALLLATDSFWMNLFERSAQARATGPATEPQAAAQEAGVEVLVTEAFKELSSQLAAPSAAGATVATEADSEEAMDAWFDHRALEQAATADAAAAQGKDQAAAAAEWSDEAVEDPAPRLSHFERRLQQAMVSDAEEAPTPDVEAAEEFSAAALAEVEALAATERAAELADEDADEAIFECEVDEDEEGEPELAADDGQIWAAGEGWAADAEAAAEDVAGPAAGELREDLVAEDADLVEMEHGLPSTAAQEVEPSPSEGEARDPHALPFAGHLLDPVSQGDEPAFVQAEEPDAFEEPEDADAAAASATDVGLRPRGFLAPVVDDESAPAEQPWTAPVAEQLATAGSDAEDDSLAAAVADSAEPQEPAPPDAPTEPTAATPAELPIVDIPRPAEGPRQQPLFVGAVDEGLVAEAAELLRENRRLSPSLLQRRLRIRYEEAADLLRLLAHRGLVDIAADGSQARARS